MSADEVEIMAPEYESCLLNAFALTNQERKIVQLIVEGQSGKEIATKLHLSVHTVRVHRSNLMSKLGIHNQTDLFHYAIKAGLVKL